MQFNRKKYTDLQLIQLYKGMLKSRLIEEKMLVLLRQNKISKWFSGIGQEAISTGATLALENDEWIFPSHRNLGVFINRGISVEKLVAQWQGKASGFTKGRERSFHFGSTEHHICGMISHMAAQLSVADGVALGNDLSNKNKVTIAFCGDGATSEGEFHEALNLAAVWSLPIIFIVENNGYALSTPNYEQFKCNNIIDKGQGYGIDSFQVDGNNVLEVYDSISQLAESIRNDPRPVLIEALTFRMRGHEEASGTKYIPEKLIEEWSKKDPIAHFEKYLLDEKVLNERILFLTKSELREEIDLAIDQAFNEPYPEPDSTEELKDVYAPFIFEATLPGENILAEKRYVDAIKEALYQSLEKHPNLILMGQDISEYGGVFKITEGLVEKFGKDRIRNTPLCESAVVGAALGLSIAGYKSVVEMQFSDFASNAFTQIVNNLAKSYYRWGQPADTVIRMPTGAGSGAGPFHSQSIEAWFYHVPGLKIVYPSSPFDAKGLLNAAIEDPNPVLYFEHKALYRSLKADIPESYYTIEIGKAALAQEGTDLTIITYGMGVHWAIKASEELKINAEIIDLRTLLPWDKDAVGLSTEKTGRVIVLNEATETGSISAEIAAWIGERYFSKLDAPVMRVGSLDTPVPFSEKLENNFLPYERFKSKLRELADF